MRRHIYCNSKFPYSTPHFDMPLHIANFTSVTIPSILFDSDARNIRPLFFFARDLYLRTYGHHFALNMDGSQVTRE